MDSHPHFVASGFLLIVSLLLCRHLADRLPGQRINAVGFLLFSVASVGISGALLLYWGASHALLALSFGLGLVASFASPAAALAFFIAQSIVRPWESSDNPALLFIPKIVGLVAIGSWIIHGIIRKRLRLLFDWPTRLCIGLCIWILLAAFVCDTPDEALAYYLSTVLIAALVFLLVSNAPASTAESRLIEKAVVWSVTGMITAATLKTVSDPSFTFFSTHRLEGFGLLGNANDLAALAVLALPLAVMRPEKTLLKLIFTAILLTGVYLTQSRGAMAGLGLGGVGYLILRSQRPRQAMLRALIALPALAIAATVFSFARDARDLNQSSTSRLNYVEAGLRMAFKNPFFGVGLNNYPRFYDENSRGATYEFGQRTAHSSWVLVLAETGFLGFFLFTGLFLVIFRRAWIARHDEPALLVAMITYGTAMSFLSHTYTFFPYLLFGLVLCASKFARVIPAAAVVTALFVAMVSASSGAAWAAGIEASSGGEKPFGPKEAQIQLHPTLDLKGSRGEVLNFVLRLDLEAPGTCGKLSLKGLGTARMRFFTMPKIRIDQPSYPGAPLGDHYDPLLPASADKICAESGQKTWLWAELELPTDAKAGAFKGSLELVVGRAKKPVELPITLKVWKMRMPGTASLPAYSEMTAWFNVIGHYGKWHEGEEVLAEKYIREMQKHRLYPVKSWIAAPELSGGRLNLSDRPTPTQSFESVTLKQRPKDLYFDFPALKTPEYYRAVQSSLTAIGRPGKAMVYLWDEPHKGELASVEALARIVRAAAPSLKIMVTTPPKPALESLVDIFVPVMDQFDIKDFPRAADYKRLQKSGHEIWWYVSCMSHGCDALLDSGVPDFVIDRPSVYVRSIAWLTEKFDMDGFLYYSVNNGYQKYPARDPWKSLWDFSGNGDGTLFYPGRPGEHGLTEHGPIPSIRLKLWRESSFDAEYIGWMKRLGSKKPAWWDSEFAKLVRSPRDWEKNYRKYQALRDKAGEYLDQNAP